MKSRSKFLKNILATASTMAVLIGNAEIAGAANIDVINDNQAVVAGNNNDTVTFVTNPHPGVTVDATGYTGVKIRTIDATADGSSLAGITNSGAPEAVTLDLAAAVHNFSLTAANYTAAQLSAVTLGAGSNLIVPGATTVAGTIDGAGAGGVGSLTTGAGSIFSGVIGGGNKLSSISVDGAGVTEFGAATSSTNITIASPSTMNITGAVVVTGNIDGATDAVGTLTLSGAGGVGVTGNIGSTKGLATLNLANSAGLATITGPVKATTINLTAASSNAKITGAVVVDTINFQNNGKLELDSTVGGYSTTNANADFAGNAATLVLKGTFTGNINNSVAGGANVLDISANGASVSGTVGVDNAVGTIKVGANGATSSLGGATNAATVQYQGTGTLNLSGYLTGNIDFQANDGILNIGDGMNITGTINNNGGAAKGQLVFKGSSVVTGAIGANQAMTSITIVGGAGEVVQLNSALATNTLTFGAGSTSTTTLFAKGAITGLTGAITADADGHGILRTNVDQNLGQDIGTNVKGLAGVQLLQTNVPGHITFTVANGKNLYAPLTTHDKIGVAKDDANILVMEGGTAKYQIGEDGFRLHEITAGASGDVTFLDNVYAKTIKVSGGNDLIFDGTAAGENKGIITYGIVAGAIDPGVIDFLNNDQTVTFTGNPIIFSDIDSSTAGAANGTVVFTDSALYHGNIGTAQPLRIMSAGANGEVVKLYGESLKVNKLEYIGTGTVILGKSDFVGPVTFIGGIDFNGHLGTLRIHDEVTVTGTIDNAGGVGGNIIFDGAGTVTGNIGTANPMTSITLVGAGDTAELQGNVNTASISFGAGSTATTTLFAKGAITGLTGAITADAEGHGILRTNVDQNLGQDIGTNAIGLAGVQLLQTNVPGHITFTVANGKNLYAPVTTHDKTGVAKDDANILVMEGGTAKYQIGEAGARLHEITAGAGGDVTFAKETYAKTFILGGNNTITLNGFKGDELQFGATTATVNVAIGKEFTAEVSTTKAGTLNLLGGQVISKDIGTAANYLAAVNLGSKDQSIAASSSIYASIITTVPGSTLVVNSNNVTFGTSAGSVVLTGAKLNVGTNKVNIPSNITMGADTTLSFDVVNDQTGNIDNTGNSTAAAFDNVTIALDSDKRLKAGQAFTIYTGSVAPTMDKSGKISYTYNSTTDILNDAQLIIDGNKASLKINGVRTLDAVLETRSASTGVGVSSSTKSFIAQLSKFDSTATGDASKVLDQLQTLPGAKLIEAVERLAPNHVATAATSNMTVDLVNQTVDTGNINMINRVADIEGNRFAENTGMAAGEMDRRIGAWLKGFGGTASQKMRHSASGYKSTSGGATIGFDMNLNEQILAGVTFTHAEAVLKHRNLRAGSKTKTKTNMIGIYGSYDVGNDIFAQASVNAGSTRVTNNDIRIVSPNATEKANSNYDVFTYGAGANVGYNFVAMDSVYITPLAGINFQNFLESGYRETSEGAQKKTVSKRNYHKITARIGAKIAGQVDISGMNLLPEVHGFFNHDFNGKAPNVQSTFDGLGGVITTKGNKPDVNSYNLGLGIGSRMGDTELSVGYDAEIRSKFIGHQGSFKVRISL